VAVERVSEAGGSVHVLTQACGSPGCAKATFAELVPGLTVRYGRRTRQLQGVLQTAGPVPG
jgi:hypothetical protein